MKISIQYQTSGSIPITVESGFDCNHSGAELQEVDYGYLSHEQQDWMDDFKEVLICDKCDAIYNNETDEWEY